MSCMKTLFNLLSLPLLPLVQSPPFAASHPRPKEPVYGSQARLWGRICCISSMSFNALKLFPVFSAVAAAGDSSTASWHLTGRFAACLGPMCVVSPRARPKREARLTNFAKTVATDAKVGANHHIIPCGRHRPRKNSCTHLWLPRSSRDGQPRRLAA